MGALNMEGRARRAERAKRKEFMLAMGWGRRWAGEIPLERLMLQRSTLGSRLFPSADHVAGPLLVFGVEQVPNYGQLVELNRYAGGSALS